MNLNRGEWRSWLAELETKPVFSTHEHHMESVKHQGLDLNGVLNGSYVGWCGPAPDNDRELRAQWLERIRTNTYFVWLERAISRIYGFDEIAPDNWDDISARISSAHADPDWHIRMMREHGGYRGFLEDCYWDSGSDVGYPAFVKPVYRLDMWMQGFHPDSRTNENTSPYELFGSSPSFEQYMERFEHELRRRREGIAGLKCASAYQRTIAFQAATREQAKAVFGKAPEETTEAERNAFGDYVLGRGLELAAELELPVQFHTGLAKLSGSNPMGLEPLIAAHPNNRIVLFHGGFPWIYETAALAHNYANVVIDVNWLPLISTSAAVQAMHVYCDVLRDSGAIAWGGDTWTGEEAVGASMAFRNVLARVLADKVSDGSWSAKRADRFADRIMLYNALELYPLEERRSSIVNENGLLPEEKPRA